MNDVQPTNRWFGNHKVSVTYDVRCGWTGVVEFNAINGNTHLNPQYVCIRCSTFKTPQAAWDRAVSVLKGYGSRARND